MKTQRKLIDILNKDKKDKEEVIEKSQYRVDVLKKIEKLEEEGKFDVDAEDDPPTIVLTPEDIDYLRTKMTSKIKDSNYNLIYIIITHSQYYLS